MATRSQNGSTGTQMMILGLAVASLMVFLAGLVVGAGTNPDTKNPDALRAHPAPERDDGPFPALIAAITTEGELVAIKTADGARRTLVTTEAASGAPTELGFGRITMPDSGGIVYYERPSADGSTVWRVGTDGGPAQRVTQGRDPAVSPDGRLLVTILDKSLVVTDLAHNTSFAVPEPPNVSLARPSWAPTSKAMVIEARTGAQVQLLTATLGPNRESLGPLTPLVASPDDDGFDSLRKPTWRASDNAIVGLGSRGGAPYGVVIDPERGTRSPFPIEGPAQEADYDKTGLYFGYVLDQGVARWQGRGNAGRLGDDLVDFVW